MKKLLAILVCSTLFFSAKAQSPISLNDLCRLSVMEFDKADSYLMERKFKEGKTRKSPDPKNEKSWVYEENELMLEYALYSKVYQRDNVDPWKNKRYYVLSIFSPGTNSTAAFRQQLNEAGFELVSTETENGVTKEKYRSNSFFVQLQSGNKNVSAYYSVMLRRL